MNPPYPKLHCTIFLLVLLLTTVSCSRAPYPSSYPFSSQRKMQSVNHWDILAQDTAEQLHRKLNDILPPHEGVCISLETDNSSFGMAFTELLKAQLFSLTENIDADGKSRETARVNYTIADEPDDQCVQINFAAQLIKHRTDRQGRVYPGTFTFLSGAVSVMRDFEWYEAVVGAGLIADLMGGTANTLPHHEVLITTKITSENRLFAMRRDMYYVNDQDSWHYEEQRPLASRQFELVGEEE